MTRSPVEQVFREQHGRAVAVLVRLLGDIDLAEEAVADAFTAAVATWPERGVPPSPAGWIITTARNRAMVTEGQALVRECLRRGQPGPYQVQAAINAVHSDAPTAAATDWGQIVALYDLLLTLTPTPVVALHRAVAVAEVDGPAAGLALVEQLTLPGHLVHAVRADLLRRLGRRAAAAAAYAAAIERVGNDAERAFLERRLAELGGPR